MDAARIEDVVGEFVDLKKRGSSLIGLCPFHNEKTPSFNVSVSKGIFKCFGCGVGGDPVRFIMEHEKYSYPEALRYLAKKYHIEIEETEQTDVELEQRNHRESLMIVTNWAAEFFTQQLWETDEGRTIGLNYFLERGFREDTIRKFELGYAPESWTALVDAAKARGYREEYLEETGLIVQKEGSRSYDRFRERVIFPIHNLTGRVLGFGGRTLKTDKQTPKYVNSPESEIYHKSRVLYGLYQARKAIAKADKCLIVEGYADVLALHQAGVENVVSSSGTALTTGQIQLVARYTKQITLLFDGDAAGVQAALRGTDMLLGEGLNVHVLLVPDGDDPDSYISKHGSEGFRSLLEEQEEDFISFKTKVLLKDAGHDPIKRAGVIREVVQSIALIPDQIKASVFIQECSRLLEIEERVLLHELNKIRLEQNRKKAAKTSAAAPQGPQAQASAPAGPAQAPSEPKEPEIAPIILQEQEFVRVLLNYGHELARWEETPELPIAPLLLNSVEDIPFQDPTCSKIVALYRSFVNKERLPEQRVFVSHADPDIARLAVSMLSPKYEISPNWGDDKRNIYVPKEEENLQELVYTSVYRIKKRWIELQMDQVREEIKQEKNEENTLILLQKYQTMKDALKMISDRLGTIILK